MLAGDGARQHGFVVLVVVAVGEFDDHLAGAFEQLLAEAVGGEHGAVARQCKTDGFGQAVHGVRGEHAGAGSAGGTHGFLVGEQVLFGDVVVGGGVHHVDQVGVLLDAAVGQHRGAGFHRAAGHENRRDVHTQGGHEHARGDLVAVRNADQGVGAMGIAGVFHGVGDDVAGRQRIQHAGVPHGDAVVHCDGVELARNATGLLYSFGDEAANLVEVHVTWHEFIEGVGDSDNRFAEILAINAGSSVQSSGACKDTAIHEFFRTHFHTDHSSTCIG